MENNKSTFANNVRKYRTQAHLTQMQLAEQLGCSDKSVSKWERAQAVPDLMVVQKLADFFHIKVENLIYDDKIVDCVEQNVRNQVKDDGIHKNIDKTLFRMISTLLWTFSLGIILSVDIIQGIFLWPLLVCSCFGEIIISFIYKQTKKETDK